MKALLLSGGCAAVLALVSTGCDTAAYCFDDCASTGSSTDTNSGGTGGSGGDENSSSVTLVGGGNPGGITVSVQASSGAGGGCEVTNPTELCNNIDDDCNGAVDDAIDFTDPRQCGNCDTNCFTLLLNVDPESITCAAPDQPGDPGTCDGDCAADYYDRDGDGNCEAYCVRSGDDDSTCDNKDDDCDGSVDEDVDVCNDNQNCGLCGRQCESPNATTACVPDDGVDDCNDSNTHCVIQECADGFVDANGNYQDGCELPCVPDETTNGLEVCGDQIDNDCDGAIDGADSDLSDDPFVGEECFGGQVPGGDVPPGLCGDPDNTGVWACSAGGYACIGGDVVEPGQIAETCNGEDDDCDGLADDNPSGVGQACGTTNVAPCRRGTFQCVDGEATCVGAIEPGTEVCNGRDDDCDTVIDDNSTDVGDPCNVPPDAPPMATTPCQGGTLVCTNGAIDCAGDIGPQAQQDTCGVDQNCDGVLTNQPDTDNDVDNCGDCDNDCYAGQPAGVLRTCTNGTCAFGGCAPGYVDLPGGAQCEYQCTPTGPEVCNGFDDDCDNIADNLDTITKPSPTQVCGVSPNATTASCTSSVTVNCQDLDPGAGQNWGWACGFPAGICPGGCSANDEICDNPARDNDCDGLINENVPNFGAACASDDANPNPGDGACRTTGTYQCSSNTTTSCSAVKANCLTLPGACVEACDNIDNDCDGSVDEPYTAKGSNSAFWYKPEVVRINNGPNQWIMAYEASRPDANATNAGSGNGYVTSAPAGETRDATPACSEQGRVPWFNVTPDEVEQTCAMMGGHICDYSTEWRYGCRVEEGAGGNCTWAYGPFGAACTSSDTASKYCNIASAWDFDSGTPGDQDGLLPTGDLLAEACYADFTGLISNPATDDLVFDMTGNLREIVDDNGTYRLVGGAFNTQSEDGATCDFSFYAVPDTFKFFDTGFRCCFDSNPTL